MPSRKKQKTNKRASEGWQPLGAHANLVSDVDKAGEERRLKSLPLGVPFDSSAKDDTNDRLIVSDGGGQSSEADEPEYMPRSEIPVDVLLNILEYVDQEDLATMCRVNKICCSFSQDVLYRDIYVLNPKIQQTLAQSTHLARKVRLFSSYFTGSDLAIALRNMTSLRVLQLSSAFNPDILDGCTFKLESFECTYLNNHGESFPKFLSSQPSLKYLTLSEHFKFTVWSLEATCLPNLTWINVKYSWLPHLIPGRPLNEVIVTGCTSYEDPIDFSIFTLSTTPIQKLTIDHSCLHPTPLHLLASFLPSLTHFTLTVLKHHPVYIIEVFGLEIDHWIEDMLVAFISLRVFTLRLRGHPRPSEEYLRYITKVSNQAPHLESFTIHHGNDHTVRCKRINRNWVVCDEAEHPAR